jgi:predicted transcriptional regulator
MKQKILNFILGSKKPVDSVDISIGIEGSIADIIYALGELEDEGRVVRKHRSGRKYQYMVKPAI